MKSPKAKGNAFEREIAERLSLWLTEGKEKRACWRSDTSGAAATNWAKKGKEQRYVQANAGDIRQIADKGLYTSLDEFFNTFVVETKHYKQIDFYPPFNKTLTNFFEACIREKATTGKKAILIMKANNRKILYCVDSAAAQVPEKVIMTLKYKELSLCVYLFDDMVIKHNDLQES